MRELLQVVVALLVPILSVLAAAHALLSKRDPRAALGWVAVCLMFPVAGAAAYLLFGINRVRTRARELSRRHPFAVPEAAKLSAVADSIATLPTDMPEEFRALARVSDAVTRRPLLTGNRLQTLANAEQAYPEMLAAIADARQQVLLATYIFDSDRSGRTFVEELARAHQRGVDVRVMVDGFGEWYSLPRISRLLRARGVPVTRFLRPRLLPPSLHLNLRNHRKLLVVDSAVAFTGGMNISDRHWVDPPRRRHPVVDRHFRLDGPIAWQMAEVFLEDWGFCTGRYDQVGALPPPAAGTAICRTIKDGPNEDLERLAMVLVGATSTAQRRVAVVSPYFLPSAEMASALVSASLRGVRVSVLLPERSNLRFIDWATRHTLWEMVRHGVGVYYQPGPFAHTKLFLVDDHYAHVGTANIDPRSLRLNFELAVEVFSHEFPLALWCEVDDITARSHLVTLDELRARSLAARLRDATAWLATPYL